MIGAKIVDDYIDSAPERAVEKLVVLRKHALEAGLTEEVKWGAPSYTGKGIVLGSAAFKEWLSLWFHQGSFLEDEQKVLLSAHEKTKGLHQRRFLPEDKIDIKRVLKYRQEAKANNEAEKKITSQKTDLIIPEHLNEAFLEDAVLKHSFSSLTLGKQRKYADHIAPAKREATQITRLEKCKPMIKQGIGLHDKYKNC